MLNLRSGAVLGSVVFDATGSSGPSEMKYSIPSSPAVLDLDGDGFVDVIYVGDVGGQLWKWDVSQVGEDGDLDGEVDNWGSGLFFSTDPASVAGTPHYRSLFNARSAAFPNGDLLLAFGSGERSDLLYAGDPGADENNRFYVVRDLDPTGAGAFSATLTEADLTDVSGLDQDPDPTDRGYYFVAEDSEKFITDNTIFGGSVIATSYLPTASGTECGGRGDSRLYVFDLGTASGFFADAGTSADEARWLSIGAGVPSGPRVAMSANGDQIYVKTSGTGLHQIPAPPRNGPAVSTIFWRQN